MKNFILSIVIFALMVTGIVCYQTYVEKKAYNIISRAGVENIEEEWNSLKKILYAFNDHDKVEEVDDEYTGMTCCDADDHRELYTIYFKEKLEALVHSTRPKLVNIL